MNILIRVVIVLASRVALAIRFLTRFLARNSPSIAPEWFCCLENVLKWSVVRPLAQWLTLMPSGDKK